MGKSDLRLRQERPSLALQASRGSGHPAKGHGKETKPSLALQASRGSGHQETKASLALQAGMGSGHQPEARAKDLHEELGMAKEAGRVPLEEPLAYFLTWTT